MKRWLAFDQDVANLAVVGEIHAGTAVEPMAGSVKGLISDACDIGAFDLIDTAGVYDHLPKDIAALLTRRLFARLKPGGKRLFAYFSTEVVPDGCVKTFMNWSLIFPDEADMRALAQASVDPGATEIETFFGENRRIICAKIRRTGA